MRQRKIKEVEEKLASFPEELFYIPVDITTMEAKIPEALELASDGQCFDDGVNESPSRRPLFLEVGCGKGRFIHAMALNHPEADFIAAEGLPSVIYRAITKVHEAGLTNVKFINSYINSLGDWFEEGELDGIFLNFSDPWPKERHSKRRLTHGNRLAEYAWAIKDGGFIRFKTDNDKLFDFTISQIEERKDEIGLEVRAITRDLHSSPYKEDSPMTESEEKFSSRGKNINFVELIKIGGR